MARPKHTARVAVTIPIDLGPKKLAEYRLEAEDADMQLGPYLQLLITQNIHLILGEDYGE